MSNILRRPWRGLVAMIDCDKNDKHATTVEDQDQTKDKDLDPTQDEDPNPIRDEDMELTISCILSRPLTRVLYSHLLLF